MAVITLSRYFLQIISVLMVGHFGELLYLSSAARTISFCAVIGFSLFCYGNTLRTTLRRSAVPPVRQSDPHRHTLMVSSLQLSLLWLYLETILLLARTLRSRMRPRTLVFRFGWENIGAATVIRLSYWLNVILLGIYMMYSPKCAKTRVPPSIEVIHPFCCYDPPRMVVVRAAHDAIRASAETKAGDFRPLCVLSHAGNTLQLHQMDYARQQAHEAVAAVILIMLSELTILCTILFAARHVFGYLFSSSEEIVSYIASMAPLLCLSVALDNLQAVLSGVARGCGWKDIGADINLGAYYLCGVPVAGVLGFWAQLRAKSVWIGILFVVTLRTDWKKEASKARERNFQGRAAVADAESLISEQSSI